MINYGIAILLLGGRSANVYAEGDAMDAPAASVSEPTGEDEDHSHIPLHHPKHPKLDEAHPENEPVPPQKLRHPIVSHPKYGN